MADPVLHLLVGPNGSGKTTFYDRVLGPATRLGLVNADRIAAERWPEDPDPHAYEAARIAAEERDRLVAGRVSFVAETVFSHQSKLSLLDRAHDAGYLVWLHVILVPEDLAVARVGFRVERGGHGVPEEKTRARYRRLWPLVAAAVEVAEHAILYDNSRAARPYRRVAEYAGGRLAGPASWPAWAPEAVAGA